MKRFLLSLIWIASLSIAHDELSEQVIKVTEKIRQNPRDASLYFERAELYRGDKHWRKAEEDYLRAKKLYPNLAAIDLGLGLLYFDTGRFPESKIDLDRFLAKNPDHAVARITRARVLKIMGKFPGAIDDFTRALKFQPDPAVYIERARLLMAENKADEALLGLNEGVAKLGPVVTMELYAIELEVQMKRYDDALARVDRIAAQAERKETWLVKRAEILRDASRNEEAKDAYVQALQAIDRLPAGRKSTRYTQDLQKRIDQALEQLETIPVQ